mmetsp:Transcript_10597/g.25602  ORF Transcript_10597/g.25602 Transcript_10597/m.25602 type:complete len:194 (-) Transcript_10597:10-591(-)
MNFFAQFTHRGENASTELKFISTRAELIDVLNGRYSMEPDSPLHDLLGHLGEEILEAACIDVTIYGRGHFSKAWIINPQHAIQRAHLGEKSTPSTPRAAILVANSMSECGGGDHDPEKVARKLRTLMNCLEKHHRNSGGRAFHVKSVPLKILRGKSIVLFTLKCQGCHFLMPFQFHNRTPAGPAATSVWSFRT